MNLSLDTSLSSIAHTHSSRSKGLTAYELMNQEIDSLDDLLSQSSEGLVYAGDHPSVLENEMASIINNVSAEDNPFSSLQVNAHIEEIEDTSSPFYRSDFDSDLPDHYAAWLSEKGLDAPSVGECDEAYAMAYLEQFKPAVGSQVCSIDISATSSIEDTFVDDDLTLREPDSIRLDTLNLNAKDPDVLLDRSHGDEDTNVPSFEDHVSDIQDTALPALSEEAQELLELRDQFITHFRNNKSLIAKDRASACEQLEKFDVSWSNPRFRIAIAKACLISEREARDQLKTFFEQAQAVLLSVSR